VIGVESLIDVQYVEYQIGVGLHGVYQGLYGMVVGTLIGATDSPSWTFKALNNLYASWRLSINTLSSIFISIDDDTSMFIILFVIYNQVFVQPSKKSLPQKNNKKSVQ
jgi:hypothetical protein